MLWYCSFTWQPGTSYQQVAERLLAQQDAITALGRHLRGWYNLVGGGAGFLILEVDDPLEVNRLLQPWMDIVSWDVRAISETSPQQVLDNARGTMPSS
jgi:hypothetical protein